MAPVLKRETLEARVTRHEGCVLKPYLDTLGNWTLGIGHLITAAEARQYAAGITVEHALAWLHADLEHASTAVLAALPWLATVTPIRREVFVELTFNLGLHGLLGFHRTLTYAEDGLWTRCSTELLLSRWAIQVKGRSVELAQLLREG